MKKPKNIGKMEYSTTEQKNKELYTKTINLIKKLTGQSDSSGVEY